MQGFFMVTTKVVLILLMMIWFNNINTFAMTLEYDGKKYEYRAKSIKLQIDGKSIETEMPPIILEGRTLVPARDVFEKLEAKVDWNEKSRQVYVTYKDKVIILTINNKTAYINQVAEELDVPAKLINGKTMIPAAFVARGLGFKVDWDEATRVVAITEGGNNATEPVIKVPAADTYDITKASLKWESSEEVKAYKISKIKSREYEDVNIEDLEIDDSNQSVIISASDKISDVTYSYADNKLTLNIEKSIMEFDSNKYTIKENAFVSGVTSTQVSKDPNKSKIVLSLKKAFNYDIALSSDRKSIVIEFLKNEIYKMDISEKNEKETLLIYGNLKTTVSAFRLTNPDRIVFDVPYSSSKLKYMQANIKSRYIKAVRTSQFSDDVTRFVVETVGQPEYDIISNDDFAKITITAPEYKNITYDNEKDEITKIVLNKPQDKSIDISKIKINDNYLQKNLQIVFSGDFTSEFGNGEIKINDARVEDVKVSKNAGNTMINIYSNTILTCNISEDEKNIYIELLKPRQKYNKIVLLDAGHGGTDPGAQVSGVQEKSINLNITTKLKKLLDEDGSIRVYITRDKDVYPTLQDRVKLAEDVQADIFVCVHNNAAFSEGAVGTETLYFPSSTKNASGLDGKTLAEIIQNTVSKEIGSKNRGILQRPDLYVLKTTTMPAALVEVGYMTNPAELVKLQDDVYITDVANGIYKGIKQVMKEYEPKRN
ncbi:MAG: hypothetical protein A2Y24_08480 [Clostridiales bacterium GWE2_32_10]|nr:MAG: hypothetical protein A2Y24_08480 [Clostridiales bacterium GWE2_32_10]